MGADCTWLLPPPASFERVGQCPGAHAGERPLAHTGALLCGTERALQVAVVAPHPPLDHVLMSLGMDAVVVLAGTPDDVPGRPAARRDAPGQNGQEIYRSELMAVTFGPIGTGGPGPA